MMSAGISLWPHTKPREGRARKFFLVICLFSEKNVLAQVPGSKSCGENYALGQSRMGIWLQGMWKNMLNCDTVEQSVLLWHTQWHCFLSVGVIFWRFSPRSLFWGCYRDFCLPKNCTLTKNPCRIFLWSGFLSVAFFFLASHRWSINQSISQPKPSAWTVIQLNQSINQYVGCFFLQIVNWIGNAVFIFLFFWILIFEIRFHTSIPLKFFRLRHFTIFRKGQKMAVSHRYTGYDFSTLRYSCELVSHVELFRTDPWLEVSWDSLIMRVLFGLWWHCSRLLRRTSSKSRHRLATANANWQCARCEHFPICAVF